MRFLPTVNPLYKNISATKIIIPDLLEKLAKSDFTGYLSHLAPDFESCCVFGKGKLLCAVSSKGGRDKAGFEALVMLFDAVLTAGGVINVYRLTPDLAMCAHALMVGQRLFKGDEVRQVNVKGILARLKVQGLNGMVCFYTHERYAVMFYKDGLPIGFSYDTATNIESKPDESRKVAALPGARIDVCSTKPLEELLQYDLLQMVNLEKLWETARSRHIVVPIKVPLTVASETSVVDDQRLSELAEDIAEVASAYLSRAGRYIVENRMNEGGGSDLLLDNARRAHFLTLIEADARAVDSDARIDEMIDLIRSEIAGRLAV